MPHVQTNQCARTGAQSSLPHIPAARRRGQALLMAVLIMLLAALLGATFITVVALNLSQTARSEDKAQARVAAYAGLEFVKKQLADKGLRWRPKNDSTTRPGVADETPPPQPGDPAYRFYYSDFDRAQGWATTGTVADTPTTRDDYDRDGFVKYPDPRGLSESDSAPSFMVKVEKTTPARDLRITVIGRTLQNPAAYAKLTAFQPGTAQVPATSAMRSVTNWDFVNKTVPAARIESIISTTPTVVVQLEKITGDFRLASGVYLTIGEPGAGAGVRGAVASAYDPATNRPTLTDDTANPQPGERIEMAAGLGAPLSIDYDNNGSVPTSDEKADFAVSRTGFSGSVRANGGLLWFGEAFARDLRSEQSANYQFAGTAPGAVRASGLMKLIPATVTEPAWATPGVTVAGEYFDGSTNQTLSDANLLSSDNNSFPGNWGTMTPGQKAQLVDDGWNRLSRRSNEVTRQVKPFTPPDITAGGGLGRYRQLSKFSRPLSPADPETASLYGYGQGIFIDNAADKERTYDAGPDTTIVSDDVGMREMTQVELVRMWLSLDDTLGAPRYARNGTPAPMNPTPPALTASLEDQHLRGWIGPNEFQARGALVEINDTVPATITITLDARNDGVTVGGTADNTTFGMGDNQQVPAKGWRERDGDLLGNTSTGGVYTRTFAWPANGVIFAEGNIRIRGQADAPPRSLTVVSMNNVYIEDSISADADDGTITDGTDDHKILLLARKNVVLNPTRVVARPEAQTRLSSAANSSLSLPVYDVSGFRRGDWISVYYGNGTAGTAVRRVTDIAAAAPTADGVVAGTLTVNQVLPPGVSANTTLVRTIGDSTNGSPAASNSLMGRVESFDATAGGEVTNPAVQRRVRLEPGAATDKVRLAFAHSAEKRDALQMRYEDGLGAPTMMAMSLKESAAPQSSVLRAGDKFLTTRDGVMTGSLILNRFGILGPLPDAPAPESPGTIPATPGNQISLIPGEAATKYILGLASAGQLSLEDRIKDTRYTVGTTNWYYAATSTTIRFNAYAAQPYYFLAGVGNRSGGAGNFSPVFPHRAIVKPLAGATTFYTMPMATSVSAALNNSTALLPNNAPALLQSDRWDPAVDDGGGTGYEEVRQFGFNPLHGANPDPFDLNGTNGIEDALTVDQSFYTAITGPSPNLITTAANPTLDSRILSAPGATTSDGLVSMALGFNNPQIDGGPNPRVSDKFAASPTSANRMPYYALSRLKLENIDQLNESGATPTYQFEKLAPGRAINVDAFVYAQEGSWFVIPGGYFSDGVQNNNDLDRNGTISRAEQVAGYRFHRYNYKINFSGAIMEHHTAIVNTSGSGTNIVRGAVSDWMNKWAAAAIGGTGYSGVWPPAGLSYDNGNFPNITYTFDDEVAKGRLDEDEGFHLPVAPELSYQG